MDARTCNKTVGTEGNAQVLGNAHQRRFQKLLDSGFMSDLKIFVRGENDSEAHKIFNVHKLIIGTACPTLYQKAKADLSGKESCVILVDKVDPNVFYLFLKFLYTGHCSLRIEDALPLLQLSRENNMTDLQEQCEQLLTEDLTDESALTIYQQAVHYKDTLLENKALKYVCRNAWNIIESRQFQALTLDNLQKLLESEQLLVLDEMQLFRSVLIWLKHQTSKQKGGKLMGQHMAATLSNHIDWEQVDPEIVDELSMTDLENLFSRENSGFDAEMPKRRCKVARKYFGDVGSTYTLSRLPQKFAYCTENILSEPEVFKFRTDKSICLTSIGIPAYSQTGGDFFHVTIQIVSDDEKSNFEVFEKVFHTKTVYHVKFPKPCKIRKDVWHTLTAVIMGTPGYGNTGGKSTSYVKCCEEIIGKEKFVKFDFKPVSKLDDISGGQIDEFRFKLAEI